MHSHTETALFLFYYFYFLKNFSPRRSTPFFSPFFRPFFAGPSRVFRRPFARFSRARRPACLRHAHLAFLPKKKTAGGDTPRRTCRSYNHALASAQVS